MTPPEAEAQLRRHAEAVAAALRAAIHGAEARVRENPDLGGASLVSVHGEVYVFVRRDKYLVEAWHHNGDEPFRTTDTDTLDAAIAAAIEAVLPADQRAPTTSTPTSSPAPTAGEEAQRATPSPPQH